MSPGNAQTLITKRMEGHSIGTPTNRNSAETCRGSKMRNRFKLRCQSPTALFGFNSPVQKK